MAAAPAEAGFRRRVRRAALAATAGLRRRGEARALLAFVAAQVTTVWPPTGTALALVLFGPRPA
jgi:hypothetical protein